MLDPDKLCKLPRRPAKRRLRPTSLGRRVLSAVTLALALVGVLAPPAAQACGMRAFHRMRVAPKPNPDALLAQARRHLGRKENVSALLAARAVIDSPRSHDASVAEAWAIIGWVRWQGGNRDAALQAIGNGRMFDREAADGMLVRAGNTEAARALRRAVGA